MAHRLSLATAAPWRFGGSSGGDALNTELVAAPEGTIYGPQSSPA